MSKEQPDGRVEGDGQDGRNGHGEVLREGQGFEETAFHPFQSKDRHEGDGNDQKGKKARPAHFFDRVDHNVLITALSAPGIPVLQLFMRLFHDHNGCIHHGADGNGNPAEAHDIGRNPHQIHGDEGEDDRNRDGNDGNKGRRDMPEKDQDHKADDDKLFEQRSLERINGPFDQIGPVISRDNLNPWGKGRFRLLQFCPDTLDDFERILSDIA